jgi:hypothetical protein
LIRLDLRCLAGRNSPSQDACLLARVLSKDGRMIAKIRMVDRVELPDGVRWETRAYEVWVQPDEYLMLACQHEQGTAVPGADVIGWIKTTPRPRVRFIG